MTFETIEATGARLQLYRDAPSWDGQRTAAAGAFSCETSDAGTDLLNNITARLASEGFDALIGPMDGDTWHSYRLVTESDGSPPFLMEPTSGSYDLAAFEGAGFDRIGAYFSARMSLGSSDLSPLADPETFCVEPWDGANAEALFAEVHDLSLRTFEQNAYYKPISRASFLEMYMPFAPQLKKELIFFARAPDGALQGFLFGLPNFQEGPAPKSAILKTYASIAPGAGRHLSHAFHIAALELGHEWAIHALIHDDNISGQRSERLGAEVFRRYALMGRRLNG